MKIKNLLKRLATSSTSVKIATAATITIWATIFVVLIAGTILLLTEQPGKAQQPSVDVSSPTIVLEPTAGPVRTSVTVRGEGWDAGSMVLIYLVAPDEMETPTYGVAGAVADLEGRFTASFVFPSEPRWENEDQATVIARAADSGNAAQALFSIVSPTDQPTETPVATSEPTATPTATATPQPGQPMVTATTNLNIRSGPGTAYPVLGFLRAGQTAEVTGISADGGWWQIKFSGAADGYGWLSAQYVTAQDTSNVPVVQAPSLPAAPTPTMNPTPTPTSTPVVISDWRGEYYDNPNLSGDPVLVRNDVSISFNWGSGSPGSAVPVDNFSARWSRTLSFSAGTYRFYAWVDDGVRLWIDGNLVIDQWHDSSPTTYSADVTLTDGWHTVVLEYYENGGSAVAQLTWERLENYPDWKAEYYNNPDLSGDPVLVRNDVSISFNWGSGSPGSAVPVDNFSARWSRTLSFSAGTYRFYAWVDDGVRLWIDGDLVIDQWDDSTPTTYTADVTLTDGWHTVVLEYYENSGGAAVQLTWELLDQPTNEAPEAVPGGPYTVNEGGLVTFDGSGSSDPDGSIVKYKWDLNYDGSTFTVDAVGQTVSTSYLDGPATVTVALRVTDDAGTSDIATTQVTVLNVAPAAEAGGPYSGEVDSLISMTGTAVDPGSVDQTGLSYHWNFGDGTQGSGQMVGHSYQQAGSYQVTLTVTDKDGAQGADTATVQVGEDNQPPTAIISGPTSGQVGETLSFSGADSADQDGSIVNYAWDFGDGSTGSGVDVDHSYNAASSYQVTLTVTDDGGLSDSATQTVQVDEPVTNLPPTAVIGGPTSGQVGETLSFSGADSADQDGLIVNYAWDFGDGTTGNGVDVDYSYNAAGSYQVTLTVTDDGGLSDSATQTVQVDEPVTNLPPSAVIGGPTSGQVGETLSFSGADSADQDGLIVSYTWDFGDGSTGNGVDVDHSYNAAGSYQVTLTVTDDGGLSDSATQTVQVAEPVTNLPPTAVIGGPTSGQVGETLSFSGAGSADQDGSIVSYTWDFGDGSTGNGVDVDHSYNAAGSYQVTLTVTDDGGLSDSATQTVQVAEPVTNLPPSAIISGLTSGQVGETLSFSGAGSADQDGLIVSYTWDFGDGSTGNGVDVDHSYNAASSYQVILTVTDDGGLSDSATQTVQVAEPVPTETPVPATPTPTEPPPTATPIPTEPVPTEMPVPATPTPTEPPPMETPVPATATPS